MSCVKVNDECEKEQRLVRPWRVSPLLTAKGNVKLSLSMIDGRPRHVAYANDAVEAAQQRKCRQLKRGVSV